jgi:hypothetical protein
MVAFALSLTVSAIASAENPLIVPEPTKGAPLNFTSEGPAAEMLLSGGGGVMKCTSVSNKGAFTGLREGTVTLTFQGCALFTKNCNTEGAAAGEVVLANAEIHLVDFKEGIGLILGAVVTLPATITIKCSTATIKLLGNVMGRINGVESGVGVEKATLLFHTEKNKQAFKVCELPAAFCKGREFLLEADFGAGKFAEAALENEDKLKFAKKVEFLF